MSQEFFCEDDHVEMVENFIAERMQAHQRGGDMDDAAYAARLQEGKWFDGRTIRMSVIIGIEHMLKYPGASDGIFAVY